MAEVNDEVIDDVTDVTEGNDTTDGGSDYSDDDMETFKRLGIDPDNFLPSDLKKIAQRVVKSENTIVDFKKKAKGDTPSESGEFVTKAQLAIDKFLDKNPELIDYTKELEQYSKKGLSLDEAKVLILSSDKARTNREKLNSLGLSDGETSKGTKTYSDEDLVALSKKDINSYNRAMNDIESGKAKHK